MNIPEHLLPRRQRYPAEVRRVRVLRCGRISPGVISLTLGGEALRGFTSLGFDDHFKLMLAPGRGQPLLLPTLREGRPVWPADLEAAQRPVMRDYTPRHFDPLALELDLEVALHGEGHADAWARQARPGDEVGIGGPKGSFVLPEGLDWSVLAGDETALPAIARRLEELPVGARVHVFVELADPADRRSLSSQAQVDLHWLQRPPGQAGQALLQALREWPLPQGLGHTWAAGEAAAMAALRHHWQSLGQPAALMRVSAYWKQGQAGHHENLA